MRSTVENEEALVTVNIPKQADIQEVVQMFYQAMVGIGYHGYEVRDAMSEVLEGLAAGQR